MPLDDQKKPLEGEVLAPLAQDVMAPIAPPDGGIPLFNRMKYNAIRKELEAYTAALSAANDSRREIIAAAALTEDYDRQLTRLDNLDGIRATAILELEADLRRAEKGLRDIESQERIEALRLRLETAQLEAEIHEAEARLERLKHPKPVESQPSSFDRMMADIAQAKSEAKRFRETIITAAGGEEHLTEEDCRLLEQLTVVTNDRVGRLMEEFGR